jgi:excisionase family DNA binding protein
VSRRRPFLPAVVPPAAAYAYSRAFGDRIEADAREYQARPGMEWLGEAMMIGLESMRESGRQWLEGRKAEQDGEVGDQDEEPVGRELSAAEAASVLGVSVEMVRRLARSQVIRARRGKGGQWLLDEVDVLAYRDRGRRRRSA